VLRENLVKFVDIPLVGRIPSLPETPPNTRVVLEIGEIDLLDLNFNARFIAAIEEVATCQPDQTAAFGSPGLLAGAACFCAIRYRLRPARPRKAADLQQPLQVVLVNAKSRSRPQKPMRWRSTTSTAAATPLKTAAQKPRCLT